MKEFISKWSNWWILNPKRKQLDDAFEKELNELIEREVALVLSHVSKSLPIKKYEIDFDGNVLAGIEISKNTPKVFGAMNGYGNGISIENIKITEK